MYTISAFFTLAVFALGVSVVSSMDTTPSNDSCNLPGNVFISATKLANNEWSESYVIMNSANEIVIDGYASESSSLTLTKCVPVGIYRLKMLHSSGGRWASGSFVIVNLVRGVNSVTIVKSRLSINNEMIVTMNLDYALLPAAHNEGIKYIIGEAPATWYTSTFVDSSWTTLIDNSRPTTTHKLQLYRTSFNVVSVNGYNGYDLRVRGRAGMVVYLNGAEIYRRNVIAGDITADSIATSGQDAPFWRSITGKMSNLVQGNNVIAVALINIANSTDVVDFDTDLRLMKESINSVRYWDFTVASNTALQPDVFSQTPSASFRTENVNGVFASITFNNDRAELFNKYCIVTNAATVSEDPREWKIEGKNSGNVWTTLKTETDITFALRSTPYCYFIPTVATAYTSYRILLVKPAVESAAFYSFSQLVFYLDDLEHVTVPELSFDPSVLVGYPNAQFPKVASSSAYYTLFSISPALPTGLSIDQNNGAIYGMLTSEHAASVHTVTALNQLGAEKTTTISVAVVTCAPDKVRFTVEFLIHSGAERLSFELKNLVTQEVIESRQHIISYLPFELPMCHTVGRYSMVLKSIDAAGWGVNSFTVRLADGTALLTESLSAGATSKAYNFNAKYEVTPHFTSWKYKIDGGAAPEKWNMLSGAPADWPEAAPGSIPVATGITQYYYKKFSSTDVTACSALEVAALAKAGIVFYLNGKEINRINMGDDLIDSTTLAKKEEAEPILFIVGDLVNIGSLLEGENILAFELHRYTKNEAVNSFDGSAILIMDNMYMMKDGTGTSVPFETRSDRATAFAFDNNPSTKFLIASQQVGVTMTWKYNNQRREPLTNYAVVAANDCNCRHASGYTLEGSNDGSEWTLLHTSNDAFFDAPFAQKRYDFYNAKPFNQYKITTKAFNNIDWPNSSPYCNAGIFQIGDIYLFSKRVDPDCPREGEWSPAMEGGYSVAECPQFYTGERKRLCENKKLGPISDFCIVEKPRGIAYDVTNLELVQNKAMTPQIPSIIAKEFTVQVYPSLPAGLQLDPKVGTISGTPTEPQELKRYTISVRNKGGVATTVLSIIVQEKPINVMMIVILIVVLVIIVVGVVVLVVVLQKNKKNGKMSSTKNPTKAPSKIMSKPSQTKTKGNIKV